MSSKPRITLQIPHHVNVVLDKVQDDVEMSKSDVILDCLIDNIVSTADKLRKHKKAILEERGNIVKIDTDYFIGSMDVSNVSGVAVTPTHSNTSDLQPDSYQVVLFQKTKDGYGETNTDPIYYLLGSKETCRKVAADIMEYL